MRAMKHKSDIKTPVEMITALLAAVPDTFNEAKARYEQIDEACRLFNADNDPLAASISETIRLLRIRTDELRKLTTGEATPEQPSESAVATPAPVPEPEVPEAAVAAPEIPVPEIPVPDIPMVETPAIARPTPFDDAEQIPTAALPTFDVPPVEVHKRDDRAADEAAYAFERAEMARQAAKWQEREKLLYKDIIHLFELGDHAGAMTSLERLLMLAPAAEELNAFLGKNEKTLLRLYRDHLGSMDRVTLPSRARKHVRIPTPDAELMLKIIRMSDGHKPIREFIKKIPDSELHILITISHLTRSGYLELA
jgi:hypothetical protein